jgi:pimeloyl-ACP methyl ester carboxylesterase
MLIDINGHAVNVQDEGEPHKPPVLLLHHGLDSVRAWEEQIGVLVEAGFRVIAYDRWGYGRSDSRPALDVPGFTTDLDDLNTLLEVLGIGQVTLIGHSDGGTIALYFAARQPGRVTCLVTVAAHIYIDAKMEPGIREIRQAFEENVRFQKGMRRSHGEKYQSVFNNWFNAWHRLEVLAWDMRPLLRQIRCPALIVQGEEDEHATPQHAKDIAGCIADSELWIIPGAKHMLPQESADEFNPRLVHFLKDHAFGDR